MPAMVSLYLKKKQVARVTFSPSAPWSQMVIVSPFQPASQSSLLFLQGYRPLVSVELNTIEDKLAFDDDGNI